jgi:hypothetical protein
MMANAVSLFFSRLAMMNRCYSVVEFGLCVMGSLLFLVLAVGLLGLFAFLAMV